MRKIAAVAVITLAMAMLLVTGYSFAYRLIYTNPGVTILTGVDKQFYIGLETDPRTYFHWTFTEPVDDTILKLTGKEFKYAKEDIMWTGRGGKEIWTFKALRQGQTTIRVKFVRTFEDKPTEVKYRTFKVRVN